MVEAKRTLVVLDDNGQLVDVAIAAGQDIGFEVIGTTSALAFDQVCRNDEPDVVVLDVQMGHADVIAVLRGLADQSIQAAVVLVSGEPSESAVAAVQYGRTRGLRMLEPITKPLSTEKLGTLLAAECPQVAPLVAADLEAAIEGNELTVHYQPTVSRVGAGAWRVTNVEALLRWNHHARGLLNPAAFVGMGEQGGLGKLMTRFVIKRGLEQLGGWRADGLDLGLRINLSAVLVTDTEFPERVVELLAEAGVAPAKLTFEITETAVLEQAPETLGILARLRVKGINLAIDDFGVGYSSLTQLFCMPFNEMKIDRSLTMRVPESRESGIMIEALIDLGHKLNLSVCAEGVESAEALAFLDRAGCDSAQGYYISRPMISAAIPDVVSDWG